MLLSVQGLRPSPAGPKGMGTPPPQVLTRGQLLVRWCTPVSFHLGRRGAPDHRFFRGRGININHATPTSLMSREELGAGPQELALCRTHARICLSCSVCT